MIDYSKICPEFKKVENLIVSEKAFFGLLLFDNDAKVKMWVMVDKSSPDITEYDRLYVDLDYDGIVGEDGERINEFDKIENIGRKFVLKNWENPANKEISDIEFFTLRLPNKITNEVSHSLSVNIKIRGYNTICYFSVSPNTPETARKIWVGFEKPLVVRNNNYNFNTYFYKGEGEVQGGLSGSYYCNQRKLMLAYPGNDSLTYWSLPNTYLDTNETLLTEIEYTTLQGDKKTLRGKLDHRCCGVSYYGNITLPCDSDNEMVLLRITPEEKSGSIVKIIPFEAKVSILNGKPIPPQNWIELGWSAGATPEENNRKMKESIESMEAKSISGVEEVKYQIFEASPGKETPFIAGENALVLIIVTVKDGYYIYGPDKGTGYINTQMNWDLPDGFKIIEVEWPKPEILKEGNQEIPVYQKKFFIRVIVQTPKTAKPGNVYAINLYSSFQYCDKWNCQLGEANNHIRLKAFNVKL
ncbi:MAG: protein-disulfide reductase DsbD family protein [Prolixibacteraceae bacterium]|nr:protein-disulfide reductase DsbD family protein [Prolixibacteraceae bacterium]